MEGNGREDLMLQSTMLEKTWHRKSFWLQNYSSNFILQFKKRRNYHLQEKPKRDSLSNSSLIPFQTQMPQQLLYGTRNTDNCSNFVLTAGHTE